MFYFSQQFRNILDLTTSTKNTEISVNTAKQVNSVLLSKDLSGSSENLEKSLMFYLKIQIK